MPQFIRLGFGHARTDSVAYSDFQQILDVFRSDFSDEPPDRGLAHFADIVIKQVIADEIGDFFRLMFWESQPIENSNGHSRSDRVVAVKSRIRPFAVFCSRLGYVMKQGGDSDFRIILFLGRVIQRAEIMLPNAENMVLVLTYAHSFQKFRNNIAQQTKLSQEFNAFGWPLAVDYFDEFVTDSLFGDCLKPAGVCFDCFGGFFFNIESELNRETR